MTENLFLVQAGDLVPELIQKIWVPQQVEAGSALVTDYGPGLRPRLGVETYNVQHRSEAVESRPASSICNS